MITSIFLIILGISLLFIVLSSTVNASLLGIIGFTFLFLLGLVLLNGTYEYTDGTRYYNMTNETAPSSSYTSTPIYTSWNDGDSHRFGWALTITGIFGFVLILFLLKGQNFKPPGADGAPWRVYRK